MTYFDAAKYCIKELRMFRDEINDFLPDSWESNYYAYPWEIADADIVYQCLHTVVGRILSTVMHNHVAQELSDAVEQYWKALSDEDATDEQRIERCQRALHNAMNELSIVFRCCKAIEQKYLEERS